MIDLLKESLKFDKKLLQTPVKDNGEKMVSIADLAEKNQIKFLFSSKKTLFPSLRFSVAQAYIFAGKEFEKMGFRLYLNDAYRPFKVQKAKFAAMVKKLRISNPSWSDYKLYKTANIHVAGIPVLAAHLFGVAVDVILLDKNGNEVDMGSKYLEDWDKAKTDCSDISNGAKANRKLLVKTMEKYGFSNYPFEWWHFSMGDVCAAVLKKNKQADYGPLDYVKSKKIFKPISEKLCYTFFKV